MQELFIHQNLLDIDKLKNEPTNLSNLKNKVDRFAADK